MSMRKVCKPWCGTAEVPPRIAYYERKGLFYCRDRCTRVASRAEKETARRPSIPDGRPDDARIYPCDDCGKLRSKNEGGTVFTVCDACWEKHYGKPMASTPDGRLEAALALIRRRHGMECPTYDNATGTCQGCEVSAFLAETPAAPPCKPWCGEFWQDFAKTKPIRRHWSGRDRLSRYCYCSEACADLGAPINPAAAALPGAEPK